LFIVLFGIAGGAVSTWLLLHDNSLKRIVIAYVCGLLVSWAAGFLLAVLVWGLWTIPDAALIGGVLGPLIAAIMSRRGYAKESRSPGDMRDS
jgi:urea transporter